MYYREANLGFFVTCVWQVSTSCTIQYRLIEDVTRSIIRNTKFLLVAQTTQTTVVCNLGFHDLVQQ